MDNLAVVILAAGKSTRMKSATSKVLHHLAGLPVVAYPVGEARRLKPEKIVLVVGKGQQRAFEEAIGGNVHFCTQTIAAGTGDAVRRAEKALRGFEGLIMIIPGDVPLITAEALEDFIGRALEEKAVCAVLSTSPESPFGYGRIIRDGAGGFSAIREEKDASDEERKVKEINTGIFLVQSKWLYENLKKITPHNAQKEYYLTDLVGLAASVNAKVSAIHLGPAEVFMGINDRAELANAGRIMRGLIARRFMLAGVTIEAPGETYIDSDVKIGGDSFIAPFVFLKGRTRIGRNCTVGAGAVIEDSVLGDNVVVKPYSVIEKSHIKDGAVVGPFSRVRPESRIEKGARVGNFVEVKKSVLCPGVKANHLSYIGDATIGAGTNVGCGTITCNYDGKKKHRTVIGRNVFIGSDVQFVAPVRIGADSIIGAGSCVTKNVPAGALAVARAKQVNVNGWARKRKK